MLKKFVVAILVSAVSLLPISGLAYADGVNLIPNPSLEASADSISPSNWLLSNWGTNTSTAEYLSTGHTGSRSIKVETTAYTDGAINWYSPNITIASGQAYEFSNWYQSNVDTEINAEVTMNDGSLQYLLLGAVPASADWAQFKTTFTAPLNIQSINIYQVLAKTGYVITDDYSLTTYQPTAFERGMVSVSFDDGWANQYANAYPVLERLNIPATFNIITGTFDYQPAYMSTGQILDLYHAGHEIGSHTITHTDLTTLSASDVTAEMQQSQAALQALTGSPVQAFAYPYGTYNNATITEGKKYYTSQRTVESGFNTADNLDASRLKIYEVSDSVSQAQVKAWIDTAIAQKSWLILVYHEVATSPTAEGGEPYTTDPAAFTAHMEYLKSTGVTTKTVSQALAEALNQPTPPVPDTIPPVITNITATQPTPQQATISWTTDEGSTSLVNYGLTSAYGSSSALDLALTQLHSILLSALSASTTYHYQVVSTDSAGNTTYSANATFTTLPWLPADINGDGTVDALDLSTLLINWGKSTGVTLAQGDINGDGTVDALDLSTLLINWENN